MHVHRPFQASVAPIKGVRGFMAAHSIPSKHSLIRDILYTDGLIVQRYCPSAAEIDVVTLSQISTLREHGPGLEESGDRVEHPGDCIPRKVVIAEIPLYGVAAPFDTGKPIINKCTGFLVRRHTFPSHSRAYPIRIAQLASFTEPSCSSFPSAGGLI